MGIVLIVVGLMLLMSVLRGQSTAFFSLIAGDFQNKGNSPSFIYWAIAIFLVGSIGYIDKARPLANAGLVLLILSVFLVSKQNVGFFSSFEKQIGLKATTV